MFKGGEDWHLQLLVFVCSFRLQMLEGTSYLLDTTFKKTELWKPCCHYLPTWPHEHHYCGGFHYRLCGWKKK